MRSCGRRFIRRVAPSDAIRASRDGMARLIAVLASASSLGDRIDNRCDANASRGMMRVVLVVWMLMLLMTLLVLLLMLLMTLLMLLMLMLLLL